MFSDARKIYLPFWRFIYGLMDVSMDKGSLGVELRMLTIVFCWRL